MRPEPNLPYLFGPYFHIILLEVVLLYENKINSIAIANIYYTIYTRLLFYHYWLLWHFCDLIPTFS